MDTRDYELLTEVEAGGLPSAGRRRSVSDFRYHSARMLQLRARGLIQVTSGVDEYSESLFRWMLTDAGRSALAHRRRGEHLALSKR